MLDPHELRAAVPQAAQGLYLDGIGSQKQKYSLSQAKIHSIRSGLLRSISWSAAHSRSAISAKAI
jgi:hypothetical protein